jgi:low affinity Fe/Cu permease
MKEAFRKFSNKTSEMVGSPWAFMGAFLIIILWAVSGPVFGFSDTWQLVINTGTTIITFLMVFLIQNTQNRDAKAIHLKLDELIRAKAGARNSLVNLENLPDEDIKVVQKEFDKVKEVCEENTGLEDAPIRGENLVNSPAKSGASTLTRQ